eukprot:COSAG01_NODE_5738_length_4066_cov_8.679859_2_plen_161_part_00
MATVDDTLNIADFGRANWAGLAVVLLFCTILLCDTLISIWGYKHTVRTGVDFVAADARRSLSAQRMRMVQDHEATFTELIAYRFRTSWSCGGVIDPLPGGTLPVLLQPRYSDRGSHLMLCTSQIHIRERSVCLCCYCRRCVACWPLHSFFRPRDLDYGLS